MLFFNLLSLIYIIIRLSQKNCIQDAQRVLMQAKRQLQMFIVMNKKLDNHNKNKSKPNNIKQNLLPDPLMHTSDIQTALLIRKQPDIELQWPNINKTSTVPFNTVQYEQAHRYDGIGNKNNKGAVDEYLRKKQQRYQLRTHKNEGQQQDKAMGKSDTFKIANRTQIQPQIFELANKDQNQSVNKQLSFPQSQNTWGNHKLGSQSKKQRPIHRRSFTITNQNLSQKTSVMLNTQQNQQLNSQIENKKVLKIQLNTSQIKLQQLKSTSATYTDQNFPPDNSSLYHDGQQQWPGIRWERMSNKMVGNQMFVEEPSPTDTRQGLMSDCYFLAALSALAERADRIYDLFMLHRKNEQGYYSVRILYRGRWNIIDLDDWIPWRDNRPAFCYSVHNQIWAIILEKAWAKLYGSYSKIDMGFPEQALHDLTGAPTKIVYLDMVTPNDPSQWNYLVYSSKKEYSMVVASPPGSDSRLSLRGIAQAHAYTLLNAFQLETKSGKQKILQLRNPWGHTQFTGKWSDFEPKGWNNISMEQKKRIGYKQNTSDGVFFMNFQDFIKEFRFVTVAEINDNASYVYKSYWDPHAKGAFFKITIIKQGEYSFHIDKIPDRAYPYNSQYQYQYPVAELQLVKISGGQNLFYQGKISNRRTLYRQYKLSPGIYVAFARINETYNDLTLAIYAEYTCNLELASREDAIKMSGNPAVFWDNGQDNLKTHENLTSNKLFRFGTTDSNA